MFLQRNPFVAILALILTLADDASPRLKLIVLTAIFLLLLPIAQVSAADINVDATCSLTQAINAANATANADTGSCETADSGADTIKLPANGKTVLTAELPHVTTNMTIETSGEGSRHIIDGDRKYSIMVVNGPGLISVTLNDLVMTRGEGGGIITRENLTINNSVISNVIDKTESGAGIWQEGGAVTINNSVINANKTASTGGGISSRSGTLTVKNSVISNNQAQESGGVELFGSTTANISNSTIYGNRAKQSGGGISGAALTGSATLTHVTIVNNSASTGGGIYKGNSGTWNVRNSIIANNRGGDCHKNAGSITIVNSIIKDGSCSSAAEWSVDPELAPPQSASPVFFPLYAGSPAIDAGAETHCLATDQRGMTRPIGDACDLGAYEGFILVPKVEEEPNEPANNDRPADNDGPAKIDEPAKKPAICTGELLNGGGYFKLSATYGLCSGAQFQRLPIGAIGNQAIIDRGPLDAIDVWNYVAQGVKVCFAGRQSGSFLFLDAATSPRKVSTLPAFSEYGMICTTIYRAGTIILLPGPPALPLAQRRISLGACMVTATHRLSFRTAPAGRAIGYVDKNWTLTALERTAGWFKVDRFGDTGWISADYVIANGDCSFEM